MAAIAMRHFDVLDYVDQSRALGVDEKVAKYQARQIESAIGQAIDQAVEIAVQASKAEIENKELATKGDIKALEITTSENIKALEKEIRALDLKIEQTRAEIHKSKFELVVWLAGFFIASGLIQHFFK